jgi:1-acylglycerone phosphate reductase
MEIMAETLRLELMPFGVGVLSVVTGAVQTNGQTYFEDWALPEGSLYASIEETISARTKGHDGVKRMPLQEYANKVVSEICRGSTGKYWLGSNASAVRYGTTLVPQNLMVRIILLVMPGAHSNSEIGKWADQGNGH